MSQQRTSSTQKANRTLSCIARSVASKAREENLPICSALVKAHRQHCTGSLQSRRDMGLLEHVQRRAAETIHRMEQLPYEDRLRDGAVQHGEGEEH